MTYQEAGSNNFSPDFISMTMHQRDMFREGAGMVFDRRAIDFLYKRENVLQLQLFEGMPALQKEFYSVSWPGAIKPTDAIGAMILAYEQMRTHALNLFKRPTHYESYMLKKGMPFDEQQTIIIDCGGQASGIMYVSDSEFNAGEFLSSLILFDNKHEYADSIEMKSLLAKYCLKIDPDTQRQRFSIVSSSYDPQELKKLYSKTAAVREGLDQDALFFLLDKLLGHFPILGGSQRKV